MKAVHAKTHVEMAMHVSGVRFQYFVLRFGFGSVLYETAVFGSVSQN